MTLKVRKLIDEYIARYTKNKVSNTFKLNREMLDYEIQNLKLDSLVANFEFDCPPQNFSNYHMSKILEPIKSLIIKPSGICITNMSISLDWSEISESYITEKTSRKIAKDFRKHLENFNISGLKPASLSILYSPTSTTDQNLIHQNLRFDKGNFDNSTTLVIDTRNFGNSVTEVLWD